MNPSSFTNQLSAVTAILNFAKRHMSESKLSGGLVSIGGLHSVGANGTGADVDLDVSGMRYSQLGVGHQIMDAGDAFGTPAQSVYQVGTEGAADFPVFADTTGDGEVGETLRCSVVVESAAGNDTPAFVLVCSAIDAAEYPTDEEIKAALEHDNCREVDRVLLTRTDATVITSVVDHGNRLDFLVDALPTIDLTTV